MFKVRRKEEKLKQFLYMDFDSVNSIIAQSEEGIIESLTQEISTEVSDKKAKNKKVEAKGTLAGAIAKLAKVEAELKGAYSVTDESLNTSLSKEFVSRTLHDEAFNIAYSNISVKEINNNIDGELGEYIKLTSEFEFIDFDYFLSLFADDGIVDFLKKNNAEKIESDAEEEKKKSGLNRETMRRAGIDFKKEVKNAITSSNKEFDDIGTIIKAVKSIVPYTYILVFPNGYIVPLNKEYFRVSPTDLGFKYGGAISCAGLLTNQINKESFNIMDGSVFAGIQNMANEILRLFINSEESIIRIIHPIAVYYENNDEK